jgi:pyruvate carboxylase
VDIFRVFDALNDIDQLEVGIKAVQRAGGVCEGTVSYSGDSKSTHSILPCSC